MGGQAVFDPETFIPERGAVAAATGYPEPYELAWRESHSGKSLADTIASVSAALDVGYDLASSLVWAEMLSLSPIQPG